MYVEYIIFVTVSMWERYCIVFYFVVLYKTKHMAEGKVDWLFFF